MEKVAICAAPGLAADPAVGHDLPGHAWQSHPHDPGDYAVSNGTAASVQFATPSPAGNGATQNEFFRFATGQATHVGCVRNHNEDSLVALPGSGVWVVSDGMGGHQAGDFASQAIIEQSHAVGASFGLPDLEARFMSRLTDAHHQIRDHAATLDAKIVGATVAGFLVAEDSFACVWSGDSRIYRYHHGQIAQQTMDHTEAQLLLTNGAISEKEALNWPRRHVITRAVGVSDAPQCDVVQGKLADDDVFLLCSDGLTEHISDEELEYAMSLVVDGEKAQHVCDALITRTLACGAHDNVTCMMVHFVAKDGMYQ